MRTRRWIRRISAFDHGCQYAVGHIRFRYHVVPSRRVRPPGSGFSRNSPRSERRNLVELVPPRRLALAAVTFYLGANLLTHLVDDPAEVTALIDEAARAAPLLDGLLQPAVPRIASWTRASATSDC